MAEHQNKGGDNDFFLLLIIGVVALMAILHFYGKDLLKMYLTLKLFETKIVGLFFPIQKVSDVINIIQTTHINDWDFKTARNVASSIGKFLTIPLIAVCAYYTNIIVNKNPLKFYKRTHTMKTLAQSEQALWPYITPALGIDILNEPLHEGMWAMSMKPIDFIRKYKLLTNENDLNSLNKEKAEKLFASQLGPMLESEDKLPIYVKALFGIMAAQGLKDKKPAEEAIKAICASAKTSPTQKKPNPDFSPALPLYEKYKNHPEIKEIIEKHAYISTAMASLLSFARLTGVFPSSYFLWLKPIDRSLFYTLNCVGRRVSFVEVAGIFGHWKAECVSKHAIEKPFVSNAVFALELALTEVKLK